MGIPTKNIFVVVTEKDGVDPSRPIVFEQYIDGDAASLENAVAFKQRLGDRYGKARIAKLQFIED